MTKMELPRMREKVAKEYEGKDIVILDSENTEKGFAVRKKGDESTFAPTVSVEVFENEGGKDDISLHFLDAFTFGDVVSECTLLDSVDEFTARSMLELVVAARFGIMPNRN